VTNSSDDARRWDARFAAPAYLFGTEPNAFLAGALRLVPPGQSVLFVADGEGRNSVFAAEQGYRVTAFDVSPVAVAKARALAAMRGVEVDVQIAGLDGWEWTPDRFDAVAAIFIQFAPPAARVRAFAGMVRTLRPGGLLMLQGYTPRQLTYGTGGPPLEENMYSEALLREAFGDHEILELAEYDAEISEGAGHHGMSALIDCIVKKR
jgi:SAM-dependent methyltransferase